MTTRSAAERLQLAIEVCERLRNLKREHQEVPRLLFVAQQAAVTELAAAQRALLDEEDASRAAAIASAGSVH